MTGEKSTEKKSESQPSPGSSTAEKLTWAVLLGRWTAFARSSVALPDDDAGRRMKASISDIITLQAVWFSLQQLHELDAAEQAIGRDRAGVLIERCEHAIRQRYAGEPLPEMLEELIDDAKTALDSSSVSNADPSDETDAS